MKKISSKVVVIIVLATIILSGVGFFGFHTAKASLAMDIALGIVAYPIQYIVVPVLGVLVRIAGFLLDKSIQFTLDSSIFGGGIAQATVLTWAIIRNIFNITFIFVLLYCAIKTIIGSASADTKKTISHVIFAALLINFSLFITRLLVDAGNIVAAAFYNYIVAGSAGTDIGAVLLDKIGIGEIFSNAGQTREITGGIFTTAFFVLSVLQVITMLTLLITFMYAALLMMTRSVALIILMILSPAGFLFDIIPMFKEYSKKWWENLNGQILLAPIFLLFLYLITLVGKGLSTVAAVVNVAGIKTALLTLGTTIAYAADPVFAADDKMYMIYFKFILITVLIIAAVKVSKNLSGEVGKAIGQVGVAAAGLALGAATGGAALLARQTIGRGAAKLASGEMGARLQDQEAKGGLKGWGSKMLLRGMNNTSKATFDARNTATFGGTMKRFNEFSGLNVNAGKAGGQYGKNSGFAGWQDKQKTEAIKRAEELEKGSQQFIEGEDAKGNKNKDKIDDFNLRLEENTKRAVIVADRNNPERKAKKQEQWKEKQKMDTEISGLENRLTHPSLKLDDARRQELTQQLAAAQKKQADYEKTIQEEDKAIFEEEKIKTKEKMAAANKDDARIINRTERKKNFAGSIRKKFWSLNTTGENNELAKLIEDDKKFTETLGKQSEAKKQKDFMDQLKKMMEDSAKK